jgi:hypothetical protein
LFGKSQFSSIFCWHHHLIINILIILSTYWIQKII